jgi:hypothetical protein
MSGVEHHEARVARVETEVQAIRGEMGALTGEVSGLKADVKGLGAILGRIEQGVLRAQERADEREVAGKPNLIAIVSVLITIISIIVGGAWLISGQLSRMDERSVWIQHMIDRNEQRIWLDRGGLHGRPAENSVD